MSYHPDQDGSSRRSLSLRVAQAVAPGHTLGLNLMQAQGVSHYDDGAAVGAAVVDTYARDLTRTAGLSWDGAFGASLQTRLAVARSRDENNNQSQYPGYYTTTQDQASWLAHWRAVPGQTLSAGLEWRQEQVDSDTPYDATERTTEALVLGWQAQMGAHRLQADLRRDRITAFGTVNTGQLGWAWSLTGDTRLRASWGNAFHAPSFNQLYYPGFGNPALKAERSVSAELGLDSRWAGWDVGATAFRNRVRDLISYTPTYELANIAHARIQGVALTAAGTLGSPATRLKLNATLQAPLDEATGQPLALRARGFGGAQLSHRLGALRLGVDLAWAGRRFDDNSGSAARHLGGYALLGLSAGWTLSPDWALDLRVKNASDKAYVLKGGYATAGREAQLTLRWTPALN